MRDLLATIVLVFAISQKLYWAGILSVLMMALGTGITVSALATLAVKAKDIALRFSGGETRTQLRVVNGLQIVAASGILVFGLIGKLFLAWWYKRASQRLSSDSFLAYSADSLNVASRKTLDMVRNNGRWTIVRESTGG